MTHYHSSVSDGGARPPSLLAQPSYLASQVSKHGRRHLERVLRERDLSLGHAAILSALGDFGALSQQQLSDALDIDKSHVVSRLDDLETRALVTRTQDPDDRRRNLITPTPTGRAMIDELRTVALQSQRGFLDTLSAAEQRTLIALLGRVLAANDAARRRAR